ncbi:MAG: hypothetical protein ABIY62_06515 [Ginsengibacter sp.]
MPLKVTKQCLCSILLLGASVFFFNSSKAQFVLNSDSAFKAGSPNSGRLWGYMFGDYYYKAHSDSLNRGSNNQYSGIPKNRNAFQIRRLYLGYDYNISKKFSAELLLAAEDNFPAFNPPTSASASGDELANGKLSFYVKLANISWKNIWKGTDFVFGEQATPTYPLLSEKIWNYRSVERTITDIRRTPSYDMGAGLQGVFDPKTKNFGYNILVGNGSSAKPASTSFKWFYGEIYHWFFNKKIVVDLYADYQRLNWQPTWHHDRQMWKGYIAYTTPALTIGAEGFVNTIRNDTKASFIANGADTINTAAQGISFYIHGDIVKNKLRFFARYDGYNPNNKIDNNTYKSYSGVSSPGGYNSNSYEATYSNTGAVASVTPTGDITAKESFVTVGLDFTPYKGVHIMPNIWYNHYSSQLSTGTNADYDLVYRMTFYFVFGK